MRCQPIRIAVWVTGLCVVAALAVGIVTDMRTQRRGLPDDFPPPASGGNVPQLGVNVALEQYDAGDLDSTLSHISGAGFVWLRQAFYWRELETAPGSFDWAASDRILAALAQYPSLRLIAVLADRPPHQPADATHFASFAAAFADRYGGQIDDYQIWDEPNLAAGWGGGPVNAAAYADLLARAAIAIRAADGRTAAPDGPPARIVLAGLAPNAETGPQNLSDVRYLELLYDAGAAPYFDVAAGKPYGFDTGPEDRRAAIDVLNFSRLILLREVMERHGDSHKAVWASQWGWNALPPGWAGAPSIWGQTDAATQAARSVAALHRARTEWPWAGALILEHYQPASDSDDPRWGFALVQPDGEQRPVFDALASWSGELPDAAPAGGYPAGNRWCSYEGAWRVGRLAADIGADHDRAKFRFDGTGVAVTIRRGPYRANLYVTVDGQPANELPKDRTGRAYVVLYDDASSVSTVPLATDLSSGVHSVTIVAEGGWDQWAIVDWRVAGARPPSRWSWQLGLLGAGALALLTLLVRDVRRRRWEAWSACLRAWPSRLQAGLAVGLTIAVWAALALALTLITRESTWAWSTTALAAALACALVSLGALLALVSASPDLGLSLAVATAPLYLIPQGMIYRALSVTEVVLLLCAAATLVERRHWRRSVRGPPRGLHALDWAVAAFVGSAIVGTALSEDLASAVLELRTVFLFPALVYILLRVMRLGPEDMNRIVIGWCAGAVIIALIGLVLYGLGTGVALAEGGLARLRSIYPSPNNVALYLGRTWPLLAAVVLWSSSSRRRWLTAGGLAVVTLALLLSFSRGALMLGLPAAIVVMCLWAGRPHRWVALGLALAGVLAMLPLAAMPRLASMFDAQAGSTFLRLELWRSSIAAIRDHPLLGLGPGQFATAYRTRYILPTAWSEPNLTHPHNILLDLWTRLGVPGLAAFFAVQWAFWKALWLRRRARTERRTDPLSVGLASSMAALLGHGLVDNTLFAPDLAVILFMTLGLAGALARAGDRADECR